MLSPFRVQKFFREAATLVKSRSDVSPQWARINGGIEWIHRVIRREIPLKALRKEFGSISDFPAIIEHLYESRLTHRNRAMAVLAHFYGVSDRTIALALKVNRHTVRVARGIYGGSGIAGLFAPKRRSNTKVNDTDLQAAIFSILHEPPSNHGINRTSWTISHLCDVLAKRGKPACPQVVRAITKAGGYKRRKARVVLTSNDPDYAEKAAA
jgi:hypothetical protein